METKEKELSLEQYLRDGIQRFQKAGGVVSGEVCCAEIIIGVTEDPIVAVKFLDDDMPPHQADTTVARKATQEAMNIIGFLDAALTRVPGLQNLPGHAFTGMDARWLHGTYKKPGGAEYSVLGCTTHCSVNVINNKTGKRRSVPRAEVGKAVAENGLTTKNGEFIPPTASKTVMQSIKEIEYGERYKTCLSLRVLRGKGDVNNVGRIFNDGNKCIGTFLGGALSVGYCTLGSGTLYVKRFSDDKVVSRTIEGADDPAAYVVDEAGNKYRLFE